MSAILLNCSRDCRLALPSCLMACLDVSNFIEKPSYVRDFIPGLDNAKKRKIKNFSFWLAHPLISNGGKCALHVISGKAERVSTSDDPTIKFQNLSSLITSSHKNPKREKPSKATTRFLFLE